MGIRLLSYRIFFTCLFIDSVVSKNIHLGVMVPTSRPGFTELGRALALAVEPAIQDVYDFNRLSREWNITYTVKDSGCHKLWAVGKTYELRNADVFIGPACSDECLSAGLSASYWNKPMISYSCSSVELRHRFFYPTFARTQPFSRTYAEETPKFLYQAMDFYNWTRAAIISAEDDTFSPIAIFLSEHFTQRYNISVPFKGFYEPGSSTFSYKTYLSPVKDDARSRYSFCVCLLVCSVFAVFLFACLLVCLFACLLVCLLVCLFACLLACSLVCLFACLPACLFVCLFACLLVCLFACLLVCLFACLLVCLFVCLLASLFVCLFVYLFFLSQCIECMLRVVPTEVIT